MPVLRCENGHFYDSAKYEKCPHCARAREAAGQAERDNPTQYMAPEDGADLRKKAKQHLVEFVQQTAPREEKTISIFSAGALHPVVGWIVCVGGREKGRDFRLHAGRNFVGRGLGMDISLPDDPQVHRENHCSIVYEPIQKQFMLVAGEGLPPSLNGEMVSRSAGLQPMDTIEIGGSVFRFVPFCGEEFTW